MSSYLGFVNYVLFLVGFALFYFILRFYFKDKKLLNIVLGAYAGYYLLFVLLSMMSFHDVQIPFLSMLNMGSNYHGFLNIFSDGLSYYRQAQELVTLSEAQLLQGYSFGGYSLVVASIYKFLGVLPLHVYVLNLWAWLILTLLVVSLHRHYYRRDASLHLAALLILCYPHLFIWSSQFLKDIHNLALVFMVLMLSFEFSRSGTPHLKRGLLFLLILILLAAIWYQALATYQSNSFYLFIALLASVYFLAAFFFYLKIGGVFLRFHDANLVLMLASVNWVWIKGVITRRVALI